MRTIFYTILLSLLFSCLGEKNSQNIDNYYFYFDAKNENMIKFPKYREDGRSLKYLYKMDKTDNVIFKARDRETRSNPLRVKIDAKDTFGLNMKYRQWLNNMSNEEKYSFFLKKSNKTFNIVEKDTLDNQLYIVRDMGFSEETE